jgi:hypothetical protein
LFGATAILPKRLEKILCASCLGEEEHGQLRWALADNEGMEPLFVESRSHVSPGRFSFEGYVAIQQHPSLGRIYVVPDVHGDFKTLIKLLFNNKLINHGIGDLPKPPTLIRRANGYPEVRWNVPIVWTGDGPPLFSGDIADKEHKTAEEFCDQRPGKNKKNLGKPEQIIEGSNSIALFLFLMELEKTTKLFLNDGNHEWSLKAKKFLSEHKLFLKELKDAGYTLDDLLAGKGPLGEFLMRHFAQGSTFGGDLGFLHGGNNLGLSADELNHAIVEGLQRDGWGTDVLASPDSPLQARFHPTMWLEEHGLAGLARFGVSLMVQGHQPGEAKMPDGDVRKRYEPYLYTGEVDGRPVGLLCADTGLSRNVGGHPTLFRIDVPAPGVFPEVYYTDESKDMGFQRLPPHVEDSAKLGAQGHKEHHHHD